MHALDRRFPMRANERGRAEPGHPNRGAKVIPGAKHGP